MNMWDKTHALCVAMSMSVPADVCYIYVLFSVQLSVSAGMNQLHSENIIYTLID